MTCEVAALLVAIYGGHKEIAKLLITKGADVNGRQGNLGVTPSNNKEIAELLITNGAHVNAKDKDGDTPLNFVALMKSQSGLDLATINGLTEIADLLRKHGGKTAEELKAEGK